MKIEKTFLQSFLNRFFVILMVFYFNSCGGSSSSKGDADYSSEVDLIEATEEVQNDPFIEDEIQIEEGVEEGDIREQQEEVTNDVQDTEGSLDGAEEEMEIPMECNIMTGAIENLYSWTQAWMGEGTSATFSLTLTNPNPSENVCDFENISYKGATLVDASDNSTIIQYDTLVCDTTPVLIQSGRSFITDCRANYSLSTTDICNSDVKVIVTVEYSINGTMMGGLEIISGAVDHDCVY